MHGIRAGFSTGTCRADTASETLSLSSSNPATDPTLTGVPAKKNAASPEAEHVRRLGPYTLIRLLGRGGMGAVWEALDTRLNRRVAVKVMVAGEHASEHDMERFRREAQNSAKLRHPNIVPVHDFGIEAGQQYLVMDLVDGVMLADALRQRQFTYREKAILLEKVARAVHYAHEQGVIHRDLKPSNIMLEFAKSGSSFGDGQPSSSTNVALPADERPLGDPLVMDFGLAKDIAKDSSLSQSGQVMGTPAYMPPEQAEGRIKDVGPRSDVYGLGAILYEMLTGRVPFTGENAMQVLRAALSDDPTPPRLIDPKIPRDLETICLKCLEKDSERRYAGAGALADDLKHWLEDEPILARPYTWTYRTAKKIAKYRVPVALATLVFVLCAGFGGWYGWEWWKTYGKWTLVFEQDFGKNADLSAWEFYDKRNRTEAQPWPVNGGSLRHVRDECAWLKDVRLAGEVRLEIALRFPDALSGMDLFINSRWQKGHEHPAGYSAQVAGWGGTVDFVSRNDTPDIVDTTSGVPSRIRPATLHKVVFQREGNWLTLAVDGAEVARQADLLPLVGEGYDRIGLREWYAPSEVLAIRVYRRALPQKANPIVAGDALFERGHAEDAERKYVEIAHDYPGTAIGDLALSKAFLVAAWRGPSGQQSAQTIKAELDHQYPSSPHRAQTLEMEAWTSWKAGRFQDALSLLPQIRRFDKDTRIVLRFLNIRREILPDDVQQSLLQAIAEIPGLNRLNVSALGLAQIDPLSGMKLTWLNCADNKLSSLEPLRHMPLTDLYCVRNRIGSLEPISGAPLRELTCDENELASLEPLRSNRSLGQLFCSHNHINDLGPLSGVPLWMLNCADNPITSLEPLRGMRFASLDCSYCPIDSLDPLRGMPLQSLTCGYSSVSDLTPLQNAPLETLNCCRAKLTTLGSISGLKLKELWCGGNSILSLTPLRGMPLQSLVCDWNKIADLDPLRNLQLKWLHCSYNQVRTLEPLKVLHLEGLNCSNNPLTSLDPLVSKPPNVFIFDCDSLPDAELERARDSWQKQPTFAHHARNAATLLAIRKNDVAALRSLAMVFQGHRYLLAVKPVRWEEARDLSVKLGGHLATLTTADEERFVLGLPVRSMDSWLGCESVAGKPAWVTGEALGHRAELLQKMGANWRLFIFPDIGLASSPTALQATERKCFIIEWDE
ncbi:MAG: protein kinase [Planctomycetota bacterium]|nr:protein kinase [Planctomycetota bacterium]